MASFNCPLGLERADRLIGLLDMHAGSRFVDLGCGRGAFLLRAGQTTRAHGLGIDIDEGLIRHARQQAEKRQLSETCEFRVLDIQDAQLAEGSFDVAACLGSTHAFGMGEAAYPNALQHMSRIVKPGGLLLIGEGYWKRPPDDEYLKLLGESPGIYHNHAENVHFAEQQGLVPLYAAVSSDDEWDHFEWSHRMRIEQVAAAHPEDAAAQQAMTRSRAWRDGYLQWGRTTMGFGFYLFARPR